MRINIEAVTVCVGYGDFLAAVVPWNAPHFNRWIIVTEEQDAETRDQQSNRVLCAAPNRAVGLSRVGLHHASGLKSPANCD